MGTKNLQLHVKLAYSLIVGLLGDLVDSVMYSSPC